MLWRFWDGFGIVGFELLDGDALLRFPCVRLKGSLSYGSEGFWLQELGSAVLQVPNHFCDCLIGKWRGSERWSALMSTALAP